MRATLHRNGNITVKGETTAECFALLYIQDPTKYPPCTACGQITSPNTVVFDASLLSEEEEKCPKCDRMSWGNVNFREGKPYVYCFECGYEEPNSPS